MVDGRWIKIFDVGICINVKRSVKIAIRGTVFFFPFKFFLSPFLKYEYCEMVKVFVI